MISQRGRDEDWREIKDADELCGLAVGRTIVAIERAADSDYLWSHGENTVTITLDDGAELRFEGWGYDASGVYTEYRSARDS